MMIPGQAALVSLLAGLLALPVAAVSLRGSPLQEPQAAGELFDRLQAAAIQHETIALLIEEEKYDSLVPELKKIFDLEFPSEYEIYQVQEVQSIVQKLRQRKESVYAHAVVDLALRHLEGDRNRAALYLLKAQLFRDGGQIREAAESTELARRHHQAAQRGGRSPQ